MILSVKNIEPNGKELGYWPIVGYPWRLWGVRLINTIYANILAGQIAIPTSNFFFTLISPYLDSKHP